jgi:hypothetical protein
LGKQSALGLTRGAYQSSFHILHYGCTLDVRPIVIHECPIDIRIRLHGDKTAVQKAREAIQDDIVQHIQAIRDMKHRLNSLTTIAVLPPELLAEIFLYLSHESLAIFHSEAAYVYHSDGRFSAPYSWLAITHVCHHWRAVALKAPQLWSVIWLLRAECVTEMLSRSRSTSLIVRANNLQGKASELDLVMRELPRIVSFQVIMPTYMQLRDWPVDAPRLKELVLHAREASETLTLSTTLLQTHFSKCIAPALEKLDLHALEGQWSNSILKSSLKHLALRGTKSPTLHTMEEIMLVLEKLPLLETLDLDSCLPQTGISENVSRIVDFPRLQSLRLLTHAITCFRFLERVNFGPYVKMAVHVYLQESTDAEQLFPMLLRLLSRHHEGESCSPTLRTLYVSSILASMNLRLQVWPTRHSVQQLYDKPANVLPEPFFELTVRNNHLLAALHLLHAVPTGDIECAMFDPAFCPRNLEKSEWTNAFAAIPKLRELGFGAVARDHVHQVLNHRVPVTEATTSGTGEGRKKTRIRKDVCMPHLTALYLYKICIYPARESFLKRLLATLERRKKAKHPLETLSFRYMSRFSEEDAKPFKAVVGKVEWSMMPVNVYEYENDWTDSMDEDEEDYMMYPYFPWLGLPDYDDDEDIEFA